MSIRKNLLWTLLPTVLGLLVLAVALVLHEVRDEIDELFDSLLVQTALATQGPRPGQSVQIHSPDDDPAAGMVIVRRPLLGKPEYYSDIRAPLPAIAQPGLHTVEIGSERWRLFVTPAEDGTIQVAQPLRIRNEATLEIAGHMLLPLAVIIPVIILSVLLLVKRGLRPLQRFTHELDARQPGSLTSLSLDELPDELLPMGTAMNELLARLSRALATQELFVADAAHELLTPLTALQVQVQILERARSEERRLQATQDVRTSLERCIALARQILTLARCTADEPAAPMQPLQLVALLHSAIAEVLPKAHLRNIDLGMTSKLDRTISGDEKSLLTLLTNLLDNAVKYSPLGSRIDVAIEARESGPAVIISDSGPGIDATDLPRVFDRFYRSRNAEAEGSGLGLAIAREIAARHGATIELKTPGRLGGLDAELVFGA